MAKGYLYDNGDELISREDVNEVPDSSTANAGDVLELDSNKKPKWTTPESELPSTGSASAGDVLSLDSDKEPVWSAPSGGGGETKYVICSTVPSNDPSKLIVEFYDPDTENVLTLQDLIDGGYTIAFGGGFASYFTVGGDSVDGYFFDGMIVYYIDASNRKFYIGESDSSYTDLTATQFLFPVNGQLVVQSYTPSN